MTKLSVAGRVLAGSLVVAGSLSATAAPLSGAACAASSGRVPRGSRDRARHRGDLVVGGPGGDLLRGNGGADRLRASGGNDLAQGGSGDDYVRLGSGHDTNRRGFRSMEPGDDTVVAGPGRDDVGGGPGNDRLFGQAGADFIGDRAGDGSSVGGLAYERGRDHVNAGSGDDGVTDKPWSRPAHRRARGRHAVRRSGSRRPRLRWGSRPRPLRWRRHEQPAERRGHLHQYRHVPVLPVPIAKLRAAGDGWTQTGSRTVTVSQLTSTSLSSRSSRYSTRSSPAPQSIRSRTPSSVIAET